MRILVSVEGQTEEEFVKKILAPHFEKKEIYVTPVSVGGAINVDRIAAQITRLLGSAHGGYVSSFYDFYGFQNKLLY
jgi:hypothetical protein